MSEPITRVYDADGRLVHDCAEAGCESSWDGYSFADGAPLAGRADPGPQWDVSRPGVARLRPPAAPAPS